MVFFLFFSSRECGRGKFGAKIYLGSNRHKKVCKLWQRVLFGGGKGSHSSHAVSPEEPQFTRRGIVQATVQAPGWL